MIRTWIADITPLYDEECYDRLYEKLPQFRREKADNLKFQKDKAQSAGVWILLEKIRNQYGISENAVYNLSHSGDYVICSIDMDGQEGIQVGCDIEKIGKSNLKVAERFFCREEYEDIRRQDTDKKQAECFCRYWVLKESFIKAVRRGMALELSSFEIQLSNPPVLIRQPKEYPDTYYYREYQLEGIPYRIAVCSNHPAIDSKIQMELKLT